MDGHRNQPAQLRRKVLGDVNPNQLNRQRATRPQKAAIQQQQLAVSKENAKNAELQPPVAQFQAFTVYESVEKTTRVLKEKPKAQRLHNQKSSPPKKVKENDENAVASPSIFDVSMGASADSSQNKIKNGSPNSPVGDVSMRSVTSSEKKATAKTLREEFFHVAQYREEIYNYMKEIEKKFRSRPDYMRKQADITHSMRAILVDWLVEVSEEYRLQTETLYLAVSYIDRFLSYMSVVRAKLQLVGTTAMFIASKFEEIYPPELGEFVYITDETYTKKQVLRMEHLILKVLSFDLSTPTPLAFISLFCITNGFSQRMLYLAMYISELALLEAEPYLQFLPSVLGASALAVARHTLLCCHCNSDESLNENDAKNQSSSCSHIAWPSSLKKNSGYDIGDLENCMHYMVKTHANALIQPHRAIVEKYKSNKYEGVASIKPKSIYFKADLNQNESIDSVIENECSKREK